MAKKEAKARDGRPVHYCTRVGFNSATWKTACGKKFDKAQRADVVLADEWEHVTCRACKEEKPDEA